MREGCCQAIESGSQEGPLGQRSGSIPTRMAAGPRAMAEPAFSRLFRSDEIPEFEWDQVGIVDSGSVDPRIRHDGMESRLE